jgi:Tfp pilus assembly protein PilN
VAAAVALTIDQPKRAKLAELTEQSQRLQKVIQTKTKQLEGYPELQKKFDESTIRYNALKRLIASKITPANVMHELGEILTTSGHPKMTEETKARIASDVNKRLPSDWDASHVWLSGFSDTGGVFKLEGGAQSEADIAQLAKRLAASVYFTDVTPAGADRVADSQTGTNYFKFTITGKVAY